MKTEIPNWVTEYNNAGHQSSAGKAVKILMTRVSELENGWISVKDRLPDNAGLCFLAGVEDRWEDGDPVWFRTVGSLTEGTDAQNNKIKYWIDWSHESMIDDVTHWMPLPEPPKQ